MKFYFSDFSDRDTYNLYNQLAAHYHVVKWSEIASCLGAEIIDPVFIIGFSFPSEADYLQFKLRWL